MTRVLHVITGLGPGGAEAMLVRLVRALSKESEHAVLTLSSEDALREEMERGGAPVFRMRLDRPVLVPGTALKVRKAIRSFRPDVVQGWMPHGNLAATLIARSLRVPHAWNIRQTLDRVDEPDLFKSRTWKLIRMAARLSGQPAAIVYNTHRGRTQHETIGYRSTRGIVIPNGFDLTRFAPSAEHRASVRAELGLPADALIVGLVARWDPQKDHAMFVKAAAQLADTNASFLLVGRGTTMANPELRSLVESAGLEGRMHMLGERRDIPRLTAALDIACCSSISEGMPNCIGEAMAAGVPCVSTDAGDAALLIGDTGLIVPPSDAEKFSNACRQILILPSNERIARGRAGRKRIQEHFSLEAIANEYRELYARLAAPGNPGRRQMRALQTQVD